MTTELKIEKILREKKAIHPYGTFSWEKNSWSIAEYCPEYFNTNKYNWKNHSWAIAKYCPEKLDPDKFNWKDDSHSILKYCPHKMDTTKANLKNIIKYLLSVPEYDVSNINENNLIKKWETLTNLKNISLEEIKEKAILNKI